MSSVTDPVPLSIDDDTNTQGGADTRASTDRHQTRPAATTFDVEDAAAVGAVPQTGQERLYMTGWRLYVLTFASVQF